MGGRGGEGKETYRPKKREKETSRDRSLLDAVTTSDPEQRKSYAHLQFTYNILKLSPVCYSMLSFFKSLSWVTVVYYCACDTFLS